MLRSFAHRPKHNQKTPRRHYLRLCLRPRYGRESARRELRRDPNINEKDESVLTANNCSFLVNNWTLSYAFPFSRLVKKTELKMKQNRANQKKV